MTSSPNSGLKEIKQFSDSYNSYTQHRNGSVISYRAVITRLEHMHSLYGVCLTQLVMFDTQFDT